MLFTKNGRFVGLVLTIAPMWDLGDQPVACEANRIGPEVVRWSTANPSVNCRAYWSYIQANYLLVCPD